MTRNDHHGPLFEHAVVRACVLDRHLDAPRGCGGGPRAAPGGGGGRTRLSVACASAGGRAVGRSVGRCLCLRLPPPRRRARVRRRACARGWRGRAFSGTRAWRRCRSASSRGCSWRCVARRGGRAGCFKGPAGGTRHCGGRAHPPTPRAGGRGENTRRHLGRGGGAARGGGCPEARARVPPPA